MLRRMALTCALLAVAVTTALAAPMAGKVVAINKKDVRVVVTGKQPVWVKKGTAVKFLGARSTITAVASDTITIAAPNAAKTKVGAAVTFDKASATGAGC
jgi:hypothetical protein